MVSMSGDEYRHTTGGNGSAAISYIINKKEKTSRVVLPDGVKKVHTLILGLDEGSIGTAGVAAVAFKFGAMVWIRTDKIHRIIRDIKLAEIHSCGGTKIF